MDTWRPPKVTRPSSLPWRTAERCGSWRPLGPASAVTSASRMAPSTCRPAPTAKASRPSSSSPASSPTATLTASGNATAPSCALRSGSALAFLGVIRPVRPVVAADILQLTEKTVRDWAAEGVLTVHQHRPRLLLDADRLHRVSHLVADLRRAGRTRGLLDEGYRRLADDAQ